MAEFITVSTAQALKDGLRQQSPVIVIQEPGLAHSVRLIQRISNWLVIVSLSLFFLSLLFFVGVIETLTGLVISAAFEMMMVSLVVGILGVSVTLDYKGYHLKTVAGEYHGEWMGRNVTVTACAVLQKLSKAKV